jgi:glycosyltransferase involved in cell wall biosynthesis
MRLAIVSDAWHPQINGVVTTLSHTVGCLEQQGAVVCVINPNGHYTVPCPTYPEIRLSIFADRRVAQALETFSPDAVHVATEGPLGAAARRYCIRRGWAFTSSYHTQFPAYLRQRLRVPEAWSYRYLRSHHRAARRTMVATERQRQELLAQGFTNLVKWSRGVDARLFRPMEREFLALPRPIFLYAGRVAVEKNLQAFLSLRLEGSKVVVGDGPDLESLQKAYPSATFVGYKLGEELARYLSAADVFVFPSRTDTFGIVMLEAMACGTPVAAFPVVGPIDVVHSGVNGVLDEDLKRGALAALGVDRRRCREWALKCTWQHASSEFASHLVEVASRERLIHTRMRA